MFYLKDMIMIFYRNHNFQFYVVCFEFFSFCVSLYFFKKNISLYSLNSIGIFTPFAVLISLPSPDMIKYIFDLNPTNLLIVIPLNSSFISQITFSLVD